MIPTQNPCYKKSLDIFKQYTNRNARIRPFEQSNKGEDINTLVLWVILIKLWCPMPYMK
jgi:hypothetical protein